MKNTENGMTIAVEYEIDYGGFESLIVTALEGGINYWAIIENESYKKINDWAEHNRNRHEPFSVRFAQYIWFGGTVVMMDAEGEEFDDPIGEISLESIKNGWQLFSHNRKHFADFLDNNTDAITADVWFQCCSLGEVVYG